MSAAASSGDGSPAARGSRAGLAAAGAAAMAACLLPPVTSLAHRYVLAETVQFTVFLMAGPALLVLGAPWRLLRLAGPAGPGSPRPLDRLAMTRRPGAPPYRAVGVLVAFMGAGLVWRLPPVVDSLARHPALVAAELVTLGAAGTGLWLELVPSPPVVPRLGNPARAAVAALAMWSTWAVAYVLGFASGPVYPAYDRAGSALSAAADQQFAVGLVWAVAGLCFVPVVFVALLTWLRDSEDADRELLRLAPGPRPRAAVRGWDRPPRRGPAAPR